MPATQAIKADFVTLAGKYPDKWVALHPDSGDVVAVGASALEVLDAANHAGIDEPLITKILRDYRIYIPCEIA